jgi:hypothetical protein
MSGTSVPSDTTHSSPELVSIAKEWASQHLEIILPLCAAAGAAVGAYFVAVFNLARTAALASSYDVPADVLSSNPLENFVWVALAGFYPLAIAFFGLTTIEILSTSSIRRIAGVLFFLILFATPPYIPLIVWGIKLLIAVSLFALVAVLIRIYRVMRRFGKWKIPEVGGWQRPRWVPTRLWEPLSRDLAAIQQSGTGRVYYARDVVIWTVLFLVLTFSAIIAVGLGGRWIGEADAGNPASAWILDGSQNSQQPVLVFRTPDYWLERPVQESSRGDGQRRFVPVGPVVVHSYDESPLRMVLETNFGIVEK